MGRRARGGRAAARRVGPAVAPRVAELASCAAAARRRRRSSDAAVRVPVRRGASARQSSAISVRNTTRCAAADVDARRLPAADLDLDVDLAGPVRCLALEAVQPRPAVHGPAAGR